MTAPIITDDNILDLFMSVLEDRETTDSVLNSIRYQGFDPKNCRMRVLRKINESSGSITVTDVLKAISIYLLRGTRVEKIRNKTSAEGLAILNRVVEALNIRFVAANELKPDDLSLSRLSASFPELVSATLCKHPEIARTFDLPISPGLCFPAGASLIPKSEVATYDVWKQWAFEFNKLINPRERSATVPSADQVNFWQITFDSSIFSDSKRDALWTKLGLTTSSLPPLGTETAGVRVEGPLTIRIPTTLSDLTTSATSPIKSSDIDPFMTDNSRAISKAFTDARSMVAGETRIIPHCPENIHKKIRYLKRIMTDSDQDSILLLEPVGRIYFGKGGSLYSSGSGVPIAINYVNKTVSPVWPTAADMTSAKWYRVIEPTAGTYLMKKLI